MSLNNTYTAQADPQREHLEWGLFGQNSDSRIASIEASLAAGKDLKWLYDQLAGAVDGAIDVIGSADEVTVNNSTSQVPLLSVPVSANTEYTISGFVVVLDNSADNDTDAAFGAIFPTGSELLLSFDRLATGATSSSASTNQAVSRATTSPLAAVTCGTIGSGARTIVRFDGHITTGSTAGTLTLTGAQAAADATNMVFERGRLAIQGVA